MRSVIVTVNESHDIVDVCERLKAKGMVIKAVLDKLQIVVAESDQISNSEIEKIEGVTTVEDDIQFEIMPPKDML